MSSLLLGKSLIDITPPVGLPLGGWPEERISDSIHQALTCRVLYLKKEETVSVLVSLDVLGISNHYANEIREEAEKQLGIPSSAIMLSATHTHSGPILPPCLMPGLPLPDELYMKDLKRKIVGAILAASQELTSVVVGFGSGKGDLGISRRLPYDNGKVGYPPRADPQGVVDQEIGVLRFDSEDGKTLAVLFSYGCHPTVAGPSLWIGPDFPGFARNMVESFYGQDTMAVFLLGNCADVRSNYTQDDGRFRWQVNKELVEEAGHRIGAEVIKTAVQIIPKQNVELSRSQVFDEIYMINGKVATTCEFQAFRIGDTAIVTNPGECFAKIGMNVRQEFGFPIMFSSITNGFLGYVPTKEAYPFEGYEVSLSYEFFGLESPIREDGESIFFNGMLNALKKV